MKSCKELRIRDLRFARTYRGNLECLGLAMASNTEKAVDIVGFFRPEVLDPAFPIPPEIVEAYGIGVLIDDLEDPLLEFGVLGWIDLALEHGVLNPLPIIETGFGHVP